MEVGAITEAARAARDVDVSLDPNGAAKKEDVVTDIHRSPSSEDEEELKSVPQGPLSPYSPWFTIFCAGFALISDGYQNNLLTLINPLFAKLYGTHYSASVKTRVSNSLLVGAILGQLSVGYICDRFGRKVLPLYLTFLYNVFLTIAVCAGMHYFDDRPGSCSRDCLFW